MKRLISALIIFSVFMTACSDNLDVTPGISFLTTEPEVSEETAIFRVIGQPLIAADSLDIPVIFGGTAERGVDYEVSADHFTLKGDLPTGFIVVSTKRLGTGKTLSLSLQIPEGYSAGKYTSSELKLQDKFGFLSFESARGFITDTTSYTISLSDSTGRTKVLSKEATVSFSVNQEKSTAIEGVDFEFVNMSGVSFAAGSAYAGFTITPIGEGPREGQDKIVLNVSSDQRFNTGAIHEMELQILRPSLSALDGKWAIDTLVTDSLHFEQLWGAECTGYSLIPEFNKSDAFSISFKQGTFSPTFSSDFKNYFIGVSNMTFENEIEITDPDGNSRNVQLVTLDKTNRFFSPAETSTDTLSYVGIYLYKEIVDEQERKMMDMYILDHTSKSFMPELESGNRYGAEKPVAADPKLYLYASFSKN